MAHRDFSGLMYGLAPAPTVGNPQGIRGQGSEKHAGLGSWIPWSENPDKGQPPAASSTSTPLRYSVWHPVPLLSRPLGGLLCRYSHFHDGHWLALTIA
jgi:hypothetical protein